MIGSQGRPALPTAETRPVHKSLDRILGFRNYTHHCATRARAKRALTAWKFPETKQRVYFSTLFPISEARLSQQEESQLISQLVKYSGRMRLR